MPSVGSIYRSLIEASDVSASLLRAEPVVGRCYVLTFSPCHNLTLPDLPVAQITKVIEQWTNIYAVHVSSRSPIAQAATSYLANHDAHRDMTSASPIKQLKYMQIFENKGAAMGCSNPHPHCQIWATSHLPEEPARELASLQRYRSTNPGKHLLSDYLHIEVEKGERIVFQNDTFVALCPWWGVWPFEVLIVPKQHRRALVDLSDQERTDFAAALEQVTRRYDNLFETHFPYSKLPHKL